MKSGTRSIGLARYTAAASKASFAVLGSAGSLARRAIIPVKAGSARTSRHIYRRREVGVGRGWRAVGAASLRCSSDMAFVLLQAFGDELADVFDLEALFGAPDLAAEVSHGQTEPTRGSHHRRLDPARR